MSTPKLGPMGEKACVWSRASNSSEVTPSITQRMLPIASPRLGSRAHMAAVVSTAVESMASGGVSNQGMISDRRVAAASSRVGVGAASRGRAGASVEVGVASEVGARIGAGVGVGAGGRLGRWSSCPGRGLRRRQVGGQWRYRRRAPAPKAHSRATATQTRTGRAIPRMARRKPVRAAGSGRQVRLLPPSARRGGGTATAMIRWPLHHGAPAIRFGPGRFRWPGPWRPW